MTDSLPPDVVAHITDLEHRLDLITERLQKTGQWATVMRRPASLISWYRLAFRDVRRLADWRTPT